MISLRPFVSWPFVLVVLVAALPSRAAEPDPRPKQDANGNPIRYAATGHVSNYDEAKVGNYTLPDPLVLRSGQPVRDAGTWLNQRRPEILKLYQDEIFGHVPASAPKATFEVVATEPGALDGVAVRKHIAMRFGSGANAPVVNVMLFLPAKATGPVPVLLHLLFGAPPGLTPPATVAAGPEGKSPGPPRGAFREAGPIPEILARGYAYAALRYTEIEGDRADANLSVVRKLALAPGLEKPAATEWGTVAAWAWGASRVLDYLETDGAVDAKRVGLVGHSRLGKTVLWASASDPRFAAVFSSCSGEMGAALARRDFGESVDDMAANFPWQFAGAFQKYAGHWSDLPVDAHMLIALSAPRPVFVTGGTQDQWADPRGEFLAQVAAGPVYRLLGKKDLGTDVLPPLDTPVISGELGFHYHTGGHTITASDWQAFFAFVEPRLRPTAVR